MIAVQICLFVAFAVYAISSLVVLSVIIKSVRAATETAEAIRSDVGDLVDNLDLGRNENARTNKK